MMYEKSDTLEEILKAQFKRKGLLPPHKPSFILKMLEEEAREKEWRTRSKKLKADNQKEIVWLVKSIYIAWDKGE